MRRGIQLLLLFMLVGASTIWAQSPDSSTVAGRLTESIQSAKPSWSLSFAKVFWSLVVFVLGWLVIRYLTIFLNALAERWSNMRLAVKRAYPIVRIIGWTVVIYIIISDVLSPPIPTLIAMTASAGIAVGLSAQDVLKNVFGGIMILFDRPFQVGDKIAVGDYYGEVINIGLRTVRIVTAEDSVVSVPNSEIVNNAVANANSGQANCQVVAKFYLPPDIDIPRAKKIATRGAAVSRYVFLEKPIAVITQNEIHEGRSVLKMSLKAYVLDIRFEQMFQSEMTELVMAGLIRHRVVDPKDLAIIR